MAVFKLLNVVAVAVAVLVLDRTITTVQACTCLDQSVCETFEGADVVVRGTVVKAKTPKTTAKKTSSTRKKFITYTLEVTSLFKGQAAVTNEREIIFTSGGDGSGTCGVSLDEGEEYLLDLHQTNDGLTASFCGLVGEWSSVDDEGRSSVESGCQEKEQCDIGCGEFQECRVYDTNRYYCADLCEPSPCADDEVCSFLDILCVHEPCPPQALCGASNS